MSYGIHHIRDDIQVARNTTDKQMAFAPDAVMFSRARLMRLADAAESTLPKIKEVEIDRWFVTSADGGHVYGYVGEDAARRDTHAWDVARPKDGPHVAIRLTGKAKVPA